MYNGKFNSIRSLIGSFNFINISSYVNSAFNNINDYVSYTSYFNYIETFNKIKNIYSKNDSIFKLDDYFYNNIINGPISNLSFKKIEMFNLYNKVFDNNLNYYSYLNSKYNDYIGEVVLSNNLKTIESQIPVHTKYVYRKDCDISFDESYDKSIINEISCYAKSIIDKFDKIETLCINREPIFKLTTDRVNLAFNINNIVTNEDGFKDIIDLLYKSIYEAGLSGQDNVAMSLLPSDSDIIMTIKRYRGFYDHGIDFAKDKVCDVLKFNKSVIGTKMPIHPIDWKKLQCEIYKRVDELLSKIIDTLNE